MPDSYFIDQYRRKANIKDQILQTGRGENYQLADLFYIVREIIDCLKLNPNHDVLDVGCANGLIDILLSGNCKSLYAIEPVEELVVLARKNLELCTNTTVMNGHASDTHAMDNQFDRVLILEVLQLIPKNEINDVINELLRVIRSKGIIFIGSIPDIKHRDQFLATYEQEISAATHLSQDQKTEILTRNKRCSWYDPDELREIWETMNCEVKQVPIMRNLNYHDQRFNLLITVNK